VFSETQVIGGYDTQLNGIRIPGHIHAGIKSNENTIPSFAQVSAPGQIIGLIATTKEANSEPDFAR